MRIKDIILIILVLILIGVVVFIDIPAVEGILQTRKNFAAQKELLEDKQVFLAKVQELIKIYDENKENIDKISFIMPSKEDIPNLIVQLESLVKDQGLILDKLEVSMPSEESPSKMISEEGVPIKQETQAKKYKTLLISLGFIGDYTALKNFFYAAEENIRLLDIDSINISRESEEVPGILKFDLTLKTYYQK